MTRPDGFIGDGMAGEVEDVLSDDALGEFGFAGVGRPGDAVNRGGAADR